MTNARPPRHIPAPKANQARLGRLQSGAAQQLQAQLFAAASIGSLEAIERLIARGAQPLGLVSPTPYPSKSCIAMAAAAANFEALSPIWAWMPPALRKAKLLPIFDAASATANPAQLSAFAAQITPLGIEKDLAAALLFKLAESGNIAKTVVLLSVFGPRERLGEHMLTPLMVATILFSNALYLDEPYRQLISFSEIDARDARGDSALDYAQRLGCAPAARALLESGALSRGA